MRPTHPVRLPDLFPCRPGAIKRRLASGWVALLCLGAASADATSLRFHGFGDQSVDRVMIAVDDPLDPGDEPGPPVDVGASDFTIEFWIRGLLSENPSTAVPCGTGDGWIYGNMVFDRDRAEPGGRDWGVSLSEGRVAFGVTNRAFQSNTLCGFTNVLDGDWHHVAVQRRESDGILWIWVDGSLDGTDWGPVGDVSYPGDEAPGGTNCGGGPCLASDPYLVIGAEKHDAGSGFPSFSGWIDEVRVSNVARYLQPFLRPTTPFTPDASTAALYHFDEGAGDTLADASGAPGGPSPGVRHFGGTPVAGPEWSAQTPFGSGVDASVPALPDGVAFEAYPNPVGDHTLLFARFEDGRNGPAFVSIHDVAGRSRAVIEGEFEAGAALWIWDGRMSDGHPAPTGVYFAQLHTSTRSYSTKFVRR